MAGKGLFAVVGAPEPDADDEYPEDMEAMDDMPMTPGEDAEGGPFESYAATVFDDSLSVEERTSALREALMTLIEEGRPL